MSGFRPLTTALIALAVLGFLIGVGALVISLSDQDPNIQDIGLGLLIGWSYIGTGLYAWYRRPSSRFGAFMTAAGFTWFIGALGAADNGWVFAFGSAFAGLAYGFLVQMLVSFPDGRLHGRTEKLLVGAIWFDVAVFLPFQILLVTTPNEDCEQCPPNPLQVIHNEALLDVLVALSVAIGAIVFVGIAFVIRRKVRASTGGQRQVLRFVFMSVSIAITLVLLSGVMEVVQINGALEDAADALAKIGLALVPFAFLFGLLRSRLSAGDAVSELVMNLGDERRQGYGVRDALSSALSDPTLKLAYALPTGGYVDSEGREVVLPDSPGCSCTSVQRDGREVAVLIHDAALDDDPELVESVGAAAALALENERLDAELRANLAELKASRARLVEAGDAERRRVERDLHDGAQQHLVALALSIRMARDAVDRNPDQAAELLDEAAVQLDTATAELRELARGIHPAVLSDRGLGPALEALASRAALPVELDDRSGSRLAAPVEAAAYFVVAEALTNAARYSDADLARVAVTRSNGELRVEVSDDGVGGADVARGSGLRGLEDRLAAVDGRLGIESDAGDGTTITAVIPCG